MGKVKGKHRLDKWYHLAKEHGYRSRASWKLVQIDATYHFLRSARSVLDLCAAPGGWMQVSVERVPVNSLVLGVDLDAIRPIRGAVALQEDITTPKCRSAIKRVMAENGCSAFDVVLHDGSPNVGGAWAKEATGQNALVIDSVKLATELLSPKGTFVTKVFRSQDYTAIQYCLKQLFDKVEVFKPPASRGTSAEIFVIGLRYKAPAKIDPRLLDFKQLFHVEKETRRVINPLDPKQQKQKRNRSGYEENVALLRELCPVSEFIWSETPLEVLGSATSITFNDPACLPIRDHKLTSEEVKALCDDLRVLSKQEFKNLLKWRIQIRKALSPSEKSTSAPSSAVPETKEDEDEKVLNEIEELTNAMERKKKRAKKVLAKRRAKDKARKALGKQMDAVEDGYTDQDLFSLSAIKGKKDLVAVDDNEYDGDVGDIRNSESEESDAEEYSSSDVDSEEERRRYDDRIEQLLDEAYTRFVSKKEGSTKQRKRSKLDYENEDQLLQVDDQSTIHSDQDSDNDMAERDANPLVVPLLGDAPTQEEIAEQWFSQDVFMDVDEHEEMDNDDSEDEMQVELPLKRPVITAKNIKPEESTGKKKSKLQEEDDFEIVPAPATDSSDSSSDESDEDDIQTKAEILACAKKMLTKKQREEMLDDAYNKYMFHDEGLPKWFEEEEKKYCQPIKPVTKEEIAAMRAQFKEINARPAKKVAEAKARKKRAALRKLEKVRKKANSISDQADINDRSKRKMIDKLYKKAEPKRPEREYVVAKKGVQVRAGKGKVLVDRRMKKDARKHGMSKLGKGKKGKQKGKGSMKNSAKGKKVNKGK